MKAARPPANVTATTRLVSAPALGDRVSERRAWDPAAHTVNPVLAPANRDLAPKDASIKTTSGPVPGPVTANEGWGATRRSFRMERARSAVVRFLRRDRKDNAASALATAETNQWPRVADRVDSTTVPEWVDLVVVPKVAAQDSARPHFAGGADSQANLKANSASNQAANTDADLKLRTGASGTAPRMNRTPVNQSITANDTPEKQRNNT